MTTTTTRILVCDPNAASVLEHYEGPRSPGRQHVLDVEVVPDGPLEQLLRVRAEHSGPLGYVADDEATALEAISRGADEAIASSALDEDAVAPFLDRLALRASLRRDRERLAEATSHAERLAALGVLVAGVGHEINNPLSALMLSVSAADRILKPLLGASWELHRVAQGSDPIDPERLRELASTLRIGARHMEPNALLREMGVAAESIASVVRDLRDFARADVDEKPELVDLQETIEQVLRMAGRDVEKVAVVERDYEPEIPQLVLPRGRLVQVLMNILVNARHAMKEIERPVHRLTITTRMDEEFVAVCIADTGPGIPAEAIERIFDPFYTTKREQYGTGLGLSISRSLLRGLGGDLVLESVHGDGATFICMLPLPTQTMVLRAMRNHSIPPGPRSTPPDTSVLVVNDDERVLKACARFLHDRCRLVLARDGQEAVDLINSGSHVDVVLTESELLGMDGPSLYDWLRSEHPELARRTIVLGLPDSGDEWRTTIESERIPVLQKPLTGPALLEAIDRVAGAPSL